MIVLAITKETRREGKEMKTNNIRDEMQFNAMEIKGIKGRERNHSRRRTNIENRKGMKAKGKNINGDRK